mgnify:CR=1 FL=1
MNKFKKVVTRTSLETLRGKVIPQDKSLTYAGVVLKSGGHYYLMLYQGVKEYLPITIEVQRGLMVWRG